MNEDDRFSGDFGQETWDLNTEDGMVAFVKHLAPSERAATLDDPVLRPYAEMHRDAIVGLIPWDDRFGEWLGPIHFCMDPPESIPESENRTIEARSQRRTGKRTIRDQAPRHGQSKP